MKKLARFRSQDATRCSKAAAIRDAASGESGVPSAVYAGSDYVVHIDPDTGNIEIFERPKYSRRATTDTEVDRPLNERLREINRRNAEFWKRTENTSDV